MARAGAGAFLSGLSGGFAAGKKAQRDDKLVNLVEQSLGGVEKADKGSPEKPAPVDPVSPSEAEDNGLVGKRDGGEVLEGSMNYFSGSKMHEEMMFREEAQNNRMAGAPMPELREFTGSGRLFRGFDDVIRHAGPVDFSKK